MGNKNGNISLCSGGIDGRMVMALFYKKEFWFGDGGVLKRGHRGLVMAVEWQRGSLMVVGWSVKKSVRVAEL